MRTKIETRDEGISITVLSDGDVPLIPEDERKAVEIDTARFLKSPEPLAEQWYIDMTDEERSDYWRKYREACERGEWPKIEGFILPRASELEQNPIS